jgi:hypothetical protein
MATFRNSTPVIVAAGVRDRETEREKGHRRLHKAGRSRSSSAPSSLKKFQ